MHGSVKDVKSVRIGMIGTGYVGLVTGCCLAELGQNVRGMDVSQEKVEQLKQGRATFFEPDLDDLLKRNLGERLDFTDSLAQVVAFAEVLIVAVGTPARKSGETDTDQVFQVCMDIAKLMEQDLVVAVKSTVPVGTCQEIKHRMNQILEMRRDCKDNSKEPIKAISVEVVSNPEFLRQGSAVHDFMNPDRIVVGLVGTQSRAAKWMREVYASFINNGAPYLETDAKASEMIKYASNAFLATKISYVNELANICDRYEVNVKTVVAAMGFDPRIGTEYLKPGPGFGGSCFPKDTLALLHMGKQKGCEPLMLKAVMEVNRRQLGQMMRKLRIMLGKFEGKVVSVLGLSFKPETDDLRESPSVKLVQKLMEERALVRVYDPKAMGKYQILIAENELTTGVSLCESLLDTCTGADCVVVMTEWSEFVSMDLSAVGTVVKARRILDAHNALDQEAVKSAGFLYEGIGLR